MGLLVAGTKYRGEFEERLKKLMEEIKQNDDIILVRGRRTLADSVTLSSQVMRRTHVHVAMPWLRGTLAVGLLRRALTCWWGLCLACTRSHGTLQLTNGLLRASKASSCQYADAR